MYFYGKRSHPVSTLLDCPGLEQSVRCVEASSLVELLPVFVKIEDWMRVLGYAHRDISAIILATREAILNAVRHGHRGQPNKILHIKYLVTPNQVLVEVEDEGFGFNPDAVADPISAWHEHQPRGRGLFLMRSYASWICFNPTGNRVTLCRERSADDAASPPDRLTGEASPPANP
jgi:anti-sigma regulatory factor (Ser/Thr protein kinase)